MTLPAALSIIFAASLALAFVCAVCALYELHVRGSARRRRAKASAARIKRHKASLARDLFH